MFDFIGHFTVELRRRWHTARAASDASYTTESVIVTATLIILALAVLAIIGAKVIGKAGSIDLG